MTSKLNKNSVNSKKITKHMISGMKLDQSSKPLSIPGKGRASNGNVKSYQVQTNNKTHLQRDQGQINKASPNKSKIINRECSSKNLSNKSEKEKTSKSKNGKFKLSASHLQSQGSAGSTLTASVKQAESLHVQKSATTVAGDVSASDNGQHTADKQLKQKKSAKKKQDGTSNWMKLCATLNIDGAKRKTKPMKRAASDDVTDQRDNSQVKRTKPDVWFDNVDKILIETESSEQSQVATDGNSDNKQMTDPLVKPDSFKGVTNCVAIDCEMVGVGPEGQESILARVSVVNHFGVCLYDKFVQPREKVTDYRTHVSGVTAELLATGEEFNKVQSEVSDLIKDRILVGHAVHNDLKVLFLTHPHRMIRDTSLYKPFRELFKGRLPSLKKLTDKVLGVSVQDGQHSSVQDAQATMRLYTMYRQKWEKQLRQEKKMGKRRKKKQAKQEND